MGVSIGLPSNLTKRQQRSMSSWGIVLLLLFTLLVSVPGEVIVRQVNTDNTESWIVRGIATYVHGGSNPTIFYFQCTSTVNNGADLSWSKVDGALGHPVGTITGGFELRIDPPVAGSAGTYICTDSATSEEARFQLTDDDPASLAAESEQTVYESDTTVINIYASTTEPLTANSITWTHNDSILSTGEFSNTRTTLTIPNTQLSDAGVYRLTITIGEGSFVHSSSSDTTLTVLALPSTPENAVIHTDSFTNGSVNISWSESTVSPSVGGRRYRYNVSSTAPDWVNIIMESTSNSVTVDSLVPSNDQYCVIVTAIDGNDKTSEGSDPACFIFNVPSGVDNVEASHDATVTTDNETSIDVTWEGPHNSSYSDNVAVPDVIGYRVTISSDDYTGQSGLLPPNTDSHTFIGVLVGSNYTVSVVAVNGVGDSIPSNVDITVPALSMIIVSSSVPLSTVLSSPLLSTGTIHVDTVTSVTSSPVPSTSCIYQNCIVTTSDNPSTIPRHRPTHTRPAIRSTAHSLESSPSSSVIPTVITICNSDINAIRPSIDVLTSCTVIPTNGPQSTSSALPIGGLLSTVVLLVTVLITLLAVLFP